ncbi:MAG: rhamnulose-1-phosphate aldolase [Spirochaetaceae bacterium]|jgi:rhamnulose-1-phosphate aldolase|nr:rhamnulose-1-phosphate aldolase [Spirochaetaceae bacterium]
MADIRDIEAMQGFIRMCTDGWQQGWHERNGGNLTYRLRDNETAQFEPFFRRDRDWAPMGVAAENLGGEYFIATGGGKFLRNVAAAPADNLCIVEINKAADAWRIVWGLEHGGRPTSEFPTHFLNHSVRTTATKGQSRVIYHAHTPALIALTYILPLSARDFTRALWQSATECPVVFPQGVGVVDWMVPGGTEIAKASAELMRLYDAVIWAHHGMFCAGPDFDLSFGLMHTIEKAADIYLRILGSGQKIRQTISDDNLRSLAAAFGITLNGEFLD